MGVCLNQTVDKTEATYPIQAEGMHLGMGLSIGMSMNLAPGTDMSKVMGINRSKVMRMSTDIGMPLETNQAPTYKIKAQAQTVNAQTKANTKSDLKPYAEVKPDADLKSYADGKAKAKAEVKPETDGQGKANNVTNAKFASPAQTRLEVTSGFKAQVRLEASTETMLNAETMINAKMMTKAKTMTKIMAETEDKAEAQSKAELNLAKLSLAGLSLNELELIRERELKTQDEAEHKIKPAARLATWVMVGRTWQRAVMGKLRLLALMSCGVLGASLLTGCSLAENEAAASSVISASSDSVKACTFLGDIDTIARATLPNARYELKLAASKLGATHVVETAAYALPYNNLEWDLGIALSGRAYKCPVGQGPNVNDPNSFKQLPYDMPHPEVNRDDPMLLGPLRPSYIGKPKNL